jgi:hypothetical protein
MSKSKEKQEVVMLIERHRARDKEKKRATDSHTYICA